MLVGGGGCTGTGVASVEPCGKADKVETMVGNSVGVGVGVGSKGGGVGVGGRLIIGVGVGVSGGGGTIPGVTKLK